MGYVFWIVGILVFIGAITTNISSSIHQIYVQLLFITSFILIGCGQIVITLNCKLTDINNKFEAIESHLQRLIERL